MTATYIARIWFKGDQWIHPQEIRLTTSHASAYERDGWTFVQANGRVLVEFHAQLERFEIVPK